MWCKTPPIRTVSLIWGQFPGVKTQAKTTQKGQFYLSLLSAHCVTLQMEYTSVWQPWIWHPDEEQSLFKISPAPNSGFHSFCVSPHHWILPQHYGSGCYVLKSLGKTPTEYHNNNCALQCTTFSKYKVSVWCISNVKQYHRNEPQNLIQN